MSNQYYFFGTRTTFIQAAPKIFRRVNGAQNSRIWGWVGERVEMVVKVHCGTVLGDEFAVMLKMRRPEQSHNALWNHLDPVSRVRDLGETFLKFRIVNYTYLKNWNQFF